MTKRLFDIFFTIFFLIIFGWVILIAIVLAAISTQSNGLFFQNRVGKNGKEFKIFKLRTINPKTGQISFIGKILRRYRLDELPQFFNVLLGDMSIVGPRPDIKGYYDRLKGEESKILELNPGITSAAAIKYSNEEQILSQQKNPLFYNDNVIFPDKVKMNLEYYHHHSLYVDLCIIFKTFSKIFS